ncbi:MAG: CDF family Co(II)/Ni(II) efflux transporter DmeF [Spirochaetaceae bacterium]
MTKRICNQNISTGRSYTSGKRRTLIVVVITALTMVLEIVFGFLSGSLALLADGVHMGTHTFALLVTLIAYIAAEKNEKNPKFAFSSGKISVLGGYTNAILLGFTAVLMLKEAIERLISPRDILFSEAIAVAVFGLIINLVSAYILAGSHGHDHGHNHEHDHEHEHSDYNMKAAYVHVLTDALTSILAIVALTVGKFFGLTWPDAVVAIIGAGVILRWAYTLLKSTGKILVDYYPPEEDAKQIQSFADKYGAEIVDLHLWRTSESSKAALIAVRNLETSLRDSLKDELCSSVGLDHITIEIV